MTLAESETRPAMRANGAAPPTPGAALSPPAVIPVPEGDATRVDIGGVVRPQAPNMTRTRYAKTFDKRLRRAFTADEFAALKAAARRLIEGTPLSAYEIARRLDGVPSTVSMWKKAGGWTRPGATTDEKDARTLSVLAKTLETLKALDRDDGAKTDAPEPADRERFNAELARRIRRWAEGRREA